MKINSINVIKGKNKWSESRTKLIHMVLDLGEYEQKPSNKIDGFYERIKEHLPSLKSHRCSIGKPGGFFKRIKDGTWMGHIIEHVALELQTLAGYDTGWGRTRGVKGKKGVYNVVFNYEDEEKGKMAAKEAFKVVNDIINDINPQIDKIVKKLKQKNLQESIRRILREEISAKEAYNEYDSIKTIIDGKRDVAFTTLENPTTKFLIFINGLKKIKVESEDETNYIVYQKRSEDLAKELFNIANKYGGKLRFDATEEDSRRIGQILNYNPKEIEDYISHNKKIRDLENNQSEEQIQESIRRILKEELYSPASDEHTPGKFVVHKSNPVWRENIELTGLQTSVGDCYQQHVGGDEECKPSIFATDSLDKEQMFDSTYDDDIWIINTECAEVTWYKDRHFDNGDYKHHIVTFENISPECLRLLHKGTGDSN